jgi:MraZ protein
MSGLYGTNKNSLDPKGRVAIPAKFRYAFPQGQQDRIYITRGIDKCISGYYYDEWRRFTKHLNKVNKDEKTKRKLKREFIGRASSALFDKQGRITIPQDLLDFAEIKNSEALIIGCGNYIEIWDPDTYNSDGQAAEEIVQKAMEELNFEQDQEPEE